MKIFLKNLLEGRTGKYAEKELTDILLNVGKEICTSESDADIIIELSTDKALPIGAYSVCGNKKTVCLNGHSENEALLAVYLALEKAGIFFDAAGIHTSAKGVDLTVLLQTCETVKPFVRYRGIRQHINFTMDISSYRIEDAKEYIRSLARMRMNAITFHSYSGMWHNNPGHFFYGKLFDIPSEDYIKDKVEGNKKFISPECEKLINDEKEVGKFAVDFLRELIDTAKEAGMWVTLSVEMNDNLDMLAETMRFYPNIDELEFVTSELGVFAPADQTYTEVLNKAIELFGNGILDADGKLPGLYPDKEVPPRIWDTIHELSRGIYAYNNKDKIFEKGNEKPIRMGLYVLCRDSLYITKRIMDVCLPKDMIRTYLPAHGTEAVVDTLKYMQFEPSDFQKTVVHSWIEFDGNMYIQQNSAGAIEHTVEFLRDFTGAESVHAVYFNHWRTSENLIPIAYSAAATERIMPLNDFSVLTADRYGFDKDAFAHAISEAGKFDTFCRDELFNVGFCFLDCWKNFPGIGWTDNWKIESIEAAIVRASEMIKIFKSAVTDATTEKGRAFIELIANRYRTTVLHIEMIRRLVNIRGICGNNNKDLTEEQKNAVAASIGAAGEMFESYLREYTLNMPDRGCQGLVVDYYATMKGYLGYLSNFYLGTTVEEVEKRAGETAPPPPAVTSAMQSAAEKN